MTMHCNICHSNSEIIFAKTILNKYSISFYKCSHCGFVQTDKPFWLKEAYENPINTFDTGIMQRNLTNQAITSLIIKYFIGKDITACDFAGGYGIFVRLMRDIGFNFLWSDAYAQNLLARGFEWKKDTFINLVTCFECLEHFENPQEEFEKIFSIKGVDYFFCTTEILPQKKEALQNWWYLGIEHGQHISFYTKHSLEIIAKKYQMHLYSAANFHFFSRKKISYTLYLMILKLFPRIHSSLLFTDTKYLKDHQKLILEWRKLDKT